MPRLHAAKKGHTDKINLAGFRFDKESLGEIVEGVSDARCNLQAMKISVGSLRDLDMESCRLLGQLLSDRNVNVIISRSTDPYQILKLFNDLDIGKTGYLDEEEFVAGLHWLNSHLLNLNYKNIFSRLAIRRIKQRDRVYFFGVFFCFFCCVMCLIGSI